MKIRFVYGTDEWGKICESIKLYLQYCHGIDCIRKTENSCCDGTEDIIVVPLFEKDKNEIDHSGLKTIRNLRKKNGYKFNTIFMVLSKQDIPDYVHPEKNMHYYAEGLLGNPEFGKVDKAVLLGEIICKKKEEKEKKASCEDREYINIINLQEKDALKHLADLIKETKKFPSKKLRELYYDIFVTYYNELDEEKKEKLKEAQKTYNELNGIQQSSHSDDYELFKAPIPFPLQELIDARDEIVKSLGGQIEGDKIIPGDKKLTLLLVDNKTDKFNEQTKPTIIEALKGFGIDGLFDIEMIGIEKHNSENFNRDYEKFQFQKFRDKKELENLDDKNEKEYYQNVIEKYKYKEGLVKTYSELIYNKVKSFHFILLDFFLNGENTYLAFDFIKDIVAIKKKEGDYSTTWYFVTSAVYDSVVKYSQSGLLAEYYESAVVNAGDDPTNKKRQIIFIYKLLTFINARITNFKNLQENIDHKLFAGDGKCKYWNEDDKICTKDSVDCLEKELLVIIRRYLHEFDDVKEVFFSNKDESYDRKNIVESLENLIKQFIWLPEADWYMIQHQIDFINNKLGGLQDKSLKKCKFSCNYMLKELEDRSKVY